MKSKFLRIAFLVVGLLGSFALASAAEASKEHSDMSKKMFTALEKGDFESFIADGDAGWKKLSKQQFDGLAAQMGPKLKAGYTVTFLGELKLRGAQVILWKLDFQGNADDMLATISIKDGKVGSFGLPRM